MLDAEEMAILLGRPLTTLETANFDLYLEIATAQLEELICCEVTKHAGDATASERTYGSRDGYRTVWVDPFSSLTSVAVDGTTIDASDYTKKQNDSFNGSWWNIIEFIEKQCGKNVVVNAVWGFATVPAELQLLLAQIFGLIGLDQKLDGNVKSKRIEDFSVTYKDSPTWQDLLATNAVVLEKYSQCNRGVIRHGRVHSFYHD